MVVDAMAAFGGVRRQRRRFGRSTASTARVVGAFGERRWCSGLGFGGV
jgi:hypothetical protein